MRNRPRRGYEDRQERRTRHVRGCWEGFCEPHYLPVSAWTGRRAGAAGSGGTAAAKDAKTFMGFRLLDLENQTVKWRTPTFGKSAVVTYAFATDPVTTPGRPQLRIDAAPGGGLRAFANQQAPIPQRGRCRLPHVGEGRRDQLPRDQRHRIRRHPHRRPGPARRARLHQRGLEAGHGARPSRKKSSAARSSASTRSSRGRSASTAVSASTTCATRLRTRSGTPSGSIIRAPPAS